MKIFLSWSGERSKKIAEALHDWLPMVIQQITPWVSSIGIEAGTRWSSEITRQLEQSSFGIICLTPENLDASWLMFEAGALSKSISSSMVVPYLFGFEPSELKGPLVSFQAIKANKKDTYKLLYAINRSLDKDGLNEKILSDSFDILWPTLEKKFKKIGLEEKNILKISDSLKVSGDVVIGDIHNYEEFAKITDKLEKLEKTILAISNPKEKSEKENDESSKQNKIFIVHGRNEGIRETVARFIEKLGIEPVILNEKPNEGKTIIEKFESYSNVKYAIILLTGDDVGGLKETDIMQSRARQNVIFELGYFIAKLGRSKVSVLYEQNVEIPSDFHGVLYIQIDNEGFWKFSLAKELRAASFSIDLNKIL